jgi:hypothetical protein
MMRLVSALVVIAGMGMASVARADSPASQAARVALAEKADLPSLRPVLPSLLRDRDVTRPDDDEGQAPSREARREAEKSAGAAAADAHAATEARKAAREAARAEADQRSASDKVRTEKVKKDKNGGNGGNGGKEKPPKPPKPPKK